VDIMRAMEPRYRQLGVSDDRWIGRSVLSKKVLATLRESFELWEQPLDELCKAVSSEQVKEYMQKPTEGEFVSETDTFNIACHRIVMGRHHSLLVTQGKVIVGILRSTDLFNSLYDMMDACIDL
jgi:CBS-domain-containing membrane protein